jgi:threonine aldolase
VESFDVYGDYQSSTQESFLRQFELEVAHCFGKEDALFCLSGGIAQSIALLIHSRSHRALSSSSIRTRNDNSTGAFACHPTSHLLLHENDAYVELLGMEAVLIGGGSSSKDDFDIDDFKQNGCYNMDPMRLSDVTDLLVTAEDYLSTYPTHQSIAHGDISTLMLELPHREIGGKLTPWDEVLEMSFLCKEKNIPFHCDGARIYEASAGYGHGTVAETADPFDSVYVSFYKGVGAISGAMLLGNSEFVAEARVWLRRMGGNLYSVLPYAVSSWKGFRENCLAGEHNLYSNAAFVNRQQKLARVINSLSADDVVSSVVQFDPATPETNMIHGYVKASLDDCNKALDEVEKNTGIRVLSRLRGIDQDNEDDYISNRSPFGCRFEWTMGKSNVLIDDEDFLLGWQEFCKVLNDHRGC